MPKKESKTWKSKLDGINLPAEFESIIGDHLDADEAKSPEEDGQSVRSLREFVAQTQADELAQIFREMADRQCETLKIYHAMAVQAAFHRSDVFIRLIVSGNRGGKTTAAVAETARALTGQDPYGKFPKTGGALYAVGRDFDHIGKTMWAKLGGFGGMRIIKDPETGLWRAFKPDAHWDKRNQKLSRPAPPFLPPRMIEGISWEERSKLIPREVRLKNGWVANFYSGKAQPPMGFEADAAWFDEEIEKEDWFQEVVLRGLIDRLGRAWWSATAQLGTATLHDLVRRAENPNDADVERFWLHIDKNPFMPNEGKRRFKEALSPDEYRIRVDGYMAIQSQVVYPEFSRDDHGCKPFAIPDDWSLYVVIDPGVQVSAALFAAVPPPDVGNQVHFWDEIYDRRSRLTTFAEKVKAKLNGRIPEAFLIDQRMGRMTQQGPGKTVERQFADAFKEIGLKSRRTGHRLLFASDDIPGRTMAFRRWMYPDALGDFRLRVHWEKCPMFCWEMPQQYYRMDPKTHAVTDKRVDKNNHLATCGEYLAAFDPKYHAPAKQKSNVVTAQQRIDYLEKRYGGGDNKRKVITMGPQGAKKP